MDGELLSLKWNNHRTTFYHVISGLRNKETYTDVTLACEGKFYPVHKLVLSTCSEYFSDIFDRTPCKNPVVVLKDIQCQDLEFLLDYMYIGEVNVRQNELSSLIKAAECLRIKGLAVPDEEPKKSGSSSSNTSAVPHGRQRPEQTSPPAKRRRAEERRVTPVGTEHSPGRPPGNAASSPDHHEPNTARHPSTSEASNPREQQEEKQTDVNTEQPPVHIKVEQQDSFEQSANDDFLSVQSNSYDGGGAEEGDGPRSSEGNTNDFPEFLQSTVEKEEPVVMSDFNPSEFPGPSGLQNSGMAPWESDNNSANFAEGLSGAVAAAVAAASQPQQQRQQQQLVSGGGLTGQPVMTTSTPTMGTNRSQECAILGIYTCSICGYETGSKIELNNHVRQHTGGWPYVCCHCAYKTRRSNDLKRHVLTRHEGGVLRPYRCSYCCYRTTHAILLRNHMAAKHPSHTLQQSQH
ncbi:uncharacterized protein [Panulirus ornatus]|uniref:uncharacterized protein isoform X4 n=1 Tax=Panulirus ornatus TaxID=150431 RepID=UPI003A87F136